MSYYFKKPFGQNGDITQIPVNDQNDGKVSYEKGWPENYELDPNTDPDEARNLSRTNFNGLFYNITEALQTLQQYGCNPYITSTDNGGEPFPYPEGGMCYYTDPVTNDFGVYYSLRSNNIDVPSENGITTKFWQRIFAKDWDVLKSNRVTNAPLYFIGKPTYAFEDNIVTFTIPHGSKFLFANGYNADYTLNSDIVYIQNDATVTLDTTGFLGGSYYLFISSEEEAILLDASEYSVYETEDFVVTDKGATSDSDVYYYNRAENKWKKRVANTSTFIDIDYSLCLVASIALKEAEMQSFETANTLQLVSYKEFETTLAKKQNTLIAGSHISLSPATLDTTVISANVPSNVTPFAVNSCNLDANGDIDLITSDSASVSYINTPTIREYAANGTVFFENLNINGDAVLAFSSTGNVQYSAESVGRGTSAVGQAHLGFVFQNSQLIQNGYITLNIYAQGSLNGVGTDRMFFYLYIQVDFEDNSSYLVNLVSIPSWFATWSGNITVPIPAGYNNKKVTKVTILTDGSGFMGRIAYSGYAVTVSNIQLYTQEAVTSYDSSTLVFKTGSNYLELLNNSANAIPLMTLDNGVIDSTYPELYSLWVQEGVMCNFQEWWNEFDSTFTFNTATETTNDAKLFIRYNDLDSDNMLSDFSVLLTYADDTTHYLAEHIALPRTQDLLLDVPDNKSIKKITVSTRYMSFLGKSSMGMIQLYNNVSDQLTFTQYPALYATSADGSKNFMLNNIAPINLTQSGYIMVNEMGAYILPATNVIRRQRTEPTIEDDPALTNGDIWLDLGSEPLCAYRRHNDQWEICYDVPVGFVEVTADASGVTIDSLEQYPINQNGYNLNAFTETIASLSGRDGRDGAPGRDGRNGADGAQGPAGVGVPAGGLQGQILAKASNANYDTTWTTMASTALFDGGQAGQTLVKNSSEDLDFSWQTIQALPSGGNSGDALVRSGTDSATWTPIKGVVAGGTTGQALVKLSNADYDYGWQNAGGGGDVTAVLDKSNFKLDVYILANSNNYTGVLYEQFVNTNGINPTADDGAVVVSTYYNQQKLEVNNTSGSAISFRLTEVTFDNATTQIQLMAESTGTITYSISTDGGTTFTALTANTPTMISTTSLILKVELASLATIKNIAIMVR